MKQHNYPDISTYLEPKMEGNIYSVLNITKELPIGFEERAKDKGVQLCSHKQLLWKHIKYF